MSEKMSTSSRTVAEPLPIISSSQHIAAFASRILSIGVLIVLFVWIFDYKGGLGWWGKSNFFNLHPFMMILGISFFLTNAIVSWRDIAIYTTHNTTKFIHFLFNLLTLGAIAVGLFVTIEWNKAPHIASLHSWIALASALLISLQAVGGLTFFLLPIFPFSIRAQALPLHAWLGTISYLMLAMTSISGLIQLEALSIGGDRSNFKTSTNMLSTVLGLLIFATALVAAYAIVPRRHVSKDLEERDGVSFEDPSRARLKTESATGYSTNPFTAEAVPPRRSYATAREERVEKF